MGARWEFRNPEGYANCVATWDGDLLRVELLEDEIDEFEDDWGEVDEDVTEPGEIFCTAAPSLDIARRELWMFGVTLDDIRSSEVVT